MPDVSLTKFLDFVSKAGTPKYTVVKQWKKQPPYNPATDFYKPIRDEIVSLHQSGLKTSILTHFMSTVTDQKKKTAYPEIIEGYKKWLGRKTTDWFEPPQGKWSHLKLDVTVNPELGLSIGDTSYIIKLYFKADPLAKNRVDIITHLMGEVFHKHLEDGYRMAVLDVRRSKLIAPTVPISGLTLQIEAEAAYWMTLWEKI